MLRLYYVSNLDEACGPADVQQILASSRRNNGKVGITGMLILHNTRVLQFLEGPVDAVLSCFERIKKDPRHASIEFSSRVEVEDRVFAEWSMGLAKADDLAPDLARSVFNLHALVDKLDKSKSFDNHPDGGDVARMMQIFLQRFSDLGHSNAA